MKKGVLKGGLGKKKGESQSFWIWLRDRKRWETGHFTLSGRVEISEEGEKKTDGEGERGNAVPPPLEKKGKTAGGHCKRDVSAGCA